MKKVLSSILTVLLAITANATVFYVSPNGNNTTGKSWTTAYTNLQTAINAAASSATSSSPNQVWVKNGTYNSTSVLTLKNNVKIYGGFAGTETSLSSRGSNKSVLTSSADYIISNIYTSSSRLTSSALIDGFILKNAVKNAIYNEYASPTINNCEFIDCTMCAIYNLKLSNLTITNCSFVGNKNGISSDNSSPTITNCTFYQNDEIGINNWNSSASVITNCTIASNYSYAANNWNNAKPTFINCTIVNNGNDAILNEESSSPIFKNCIIWGNSGARQISNDPTSTSTVSYSVVQGGYSGGTGIITTDPKLGTIGDNGGYVDTIPVLQNSSAIAAGTTGMDIPLADARGVMRATIPTIGAYEFEVSVTMSINANTFNVGKEYTITVTSTVTPESYVLYKNGMEVARQSSNVFKVSESSAQTATYTAEVVWGMNVYESSNSLKVVYASSVPDVDVFYVKTSGSDSNDGTSWSKAFASVQKAIDTAASIASSSKPRQVWIAKGTYFNDGGNDESDCFVMRNNVTIYGGFSGTETSIYNRNINNKTILSTNGRIVIYNSSYGVTSSSVLDGVTISGGSYCAVYNRSSSPTFKNCTLSNNIDYGFYNYDSTSIIDSCTITGSYSAVFSANAPVKIINCTITANSVAIENYISSPNIINCTIVDNESYSIFNTSTSYPVVKNSILNSSISNDSSSTTTVSYCLLSETYSGGMSNIVTSDQKLGELSSNGGLVQTIPLMQGSPAIASGTTGSDIPTVDARVITRESPPSIGAYESPVTVNIYTASSTPYYVGESYSVVASSM